MTTPPYRALADIVGVTHVASITNVLVVTPSLPVRTAPEFVTHARARPGELNYASLGIGSASHLAGEVFTRAVGIDAMHVPFAISPTPSSRWGSGECTTPCSLCRRCWRRCAKGACARWQ